MKWLTPAPPPIIDSARTLCYAICDHDVAFTDRITLIVGRERLGEVSHLAICRNYSMPDDILLLFCDSSWESKSVIACDSIEAAKAQAEVGYKWISKKWMEMESSKQEIDRFLREVYEVDPDTEWWKSIYSFCGKEDRDTDGMLSSDNAVICYACIREFHKCITEGGGTSSDADPAC